VGIIKVAISQILILRSPMYDNKKEVDNPEDLLSNKTKELISTYKTHLSKLPEVHTKRYMNLIAPDDPRKIDPISFITLLINEYVEDCAYVLEIDYMPDE